MTERVDAVVVGAGVIGLAIARALARAGHEVVVLERERAVGQHGSSRNSEVIHAGLYYPPGSLKARLCVQGRRALLELCRTRGIAHRRLGKLVVATTEAERPALAAVLDTARANGVDDLQPLDATQLRTMEPRLSARAGLLSPGTGIVDSHGLMRTLWAEAEDHGAALALDTAFVRARPRGDGLRVHAGDAVVDCTWLVNAAGLGAQAVAAAIEGLPASAIPPRHLLRGCYFTVAGPAAFSRLIYPVPDPHSLGIHVTLDLGGGLRLGPDREWVDAIDYRVDPDRARGFAQAARRYWPDLDPAALSPAYAGIRAKIQGPDDPPADFRIDGPATHGIPGLCNLFGIESPGLTASLAIADEVLRRLDVPGAAKA